MQPLIEGPHTTEHPIGNAEDDFDKRERRLKAFAHKYRAQAKEFFEADIRGGLWLDDHGNFYHLFAPIDIDTTFFETPDIIGALAREPDSPALNENPIHLTKREFAAITMRVPQSGIDWLDDMIREANRREVSMNAPPMLDQWLSDSCSKGEHWAASDSAWRVFYADALLAALAKETP
jgi:hypothetical protein